MSHVLSAPCTVPFPDIGISKRTAVEVVRCSDPMGKGDLLRGMERIGQIWSDYCQNGSDEYEWDDQFVEAWEYEFEAFNVIFNDMARLFGISGDYTSMKRAR